MRKMNIEQKVLSSQRVLDKGTGKEIYIVSDRWGNDVVIPTSIKIGVATVQVVLNDGEFYSFDPLRGKLNLDLATNNVDCFIKNTLITLMQVLLYPSDIFRLVENEALEHFYKPILMGFYTMLKLNKFSLAHADEEEARLPRPRRININGTSFKVIYVNDLMEVDEEETYGLFVVQDGIYVSTKIEGGEPIHDHFVDVTFLHEIFHAIIYELGLNGTVSNRDPENIELEEIVVETLASRIVELLHLNNMKIVKRA